MTWGPGWYVLENGLGIYLPEARSCSCGEPTKLITRDGASCPRCKEKRLRGERVLARLDCRTWTITEIGRKRMDLEQIMRQVEAMRELQKEFFGTRHEDRPPDLVRRARAAEKAVDAAIAGWKQGQGTLFGGASRCD